MARARSLKPGFFKNELLAEVEPLGRLLFQGLWCLADREGRLEDRPKRLKVEILPYDTCDVESLLQALRARGFIMRYEVDGQRYILVTNFTRHQNPHCKEAASSIPAPCEQQSSTVQAQCSYRADTGNSGTSRADSFNPIPLTPLPQPKDHRASADADSLSDGFEQFWAAYPAKKARPNAAKAWQKLHPDEHMQAAILAGIERDSDSEQWKRDGGRFIPHPATWLNQRRWEDEATAQGNGTSASTGWWQRAGFATEGAAADAGCWQSNWREFQGGQRVKVPA